MFYRLLAPIVLLATALSIPFAFTLNRALGVLLLIFFGPSLALLVFYQIKSRYLAGHFEPMYLSGGPSISWAGRQYGIKKLDSVLLLRSENAHQEDETTEWVGQVKVELKDLTRDLGSS